MAPTRTCAVDACEEKHHAKGLCQKHYRVAWYQENIERERARSAAYHVANAKRRRAYDASWRAANIERKRAKDSAWRAANPDYDATWRAANPDYGATWRAANPEKRRAQKSRRRARRLGNRVEPYERLAIFDRDQWTCKLCDEPIDRALRWPDPGSASLDHIVPIARGGADAPDNVWASHLLCNLQKGTRAA